MYLQVETYMPRTEASIVCLPETNRNIPVRQGVRGNWPMTR